MDTTALTPLLIDAKKEYVGQLTDVLAPYVLNYMAAVYVAAQKANRNAGTLAFQRALRDIPGWNSTAVHQRTAEIQNRYSFLGDLVAATFVAFVKVLSSVKLHHQKPNIRLKLPSNDTFVHKVYVHAAREFYNNPALVHADRAVKLAVVRAAVEASVRDMLPIEDILKAYLGNTVDGADNTMNPGAFADYDDDPVGPDDDDDQFQMMMPTPPAPPAPHRHPHPHPQPHPQPQFPAPAPQPQQHPQPQFPAPAPHPQQHPQPQFPAPAPPQPPQELPLFVSEQSPPDEEPKRISIGPSRSVPPPGPQQELFSDAEDEF
jgi:hypothetical protein